jgi:hypothetical protein
MTAKHHPHATIHTQALDFWLARGAVLVIAVLQMLFVNSNLVMGPKWLGPALELAILAPLSVATAWTQRRAQTATEERHWLVVGQFRRAIRLTALLLTVLVMLMNFEALIAVVRALISGSKGPSGQSLLIDALNIWFTNVVVFALWYWNIDAGGPASRGLSGKAAPDFLFPQMLGSGDGDPGWSPGFIDYFYVSFTNATAFSPTDTMPLSPQSKILMAIEAAVSLLTVGIVAARAVNILS